MAHSIGQSIPLACQDWSNTRAAYRFLSKPKVDEERILAGHFQAAKERATASGVLILILHDTTELTFYGESAQELGMLHKGFKSGGKQPDVVRGILTHSSRAVTIDGLPLILLCHGRRAQHNGQHGSRPASALATRILRVAVECGL
ncbi:MAG: hypothetical protein INH43_18935 [Acidobacteriaceae bacterium]|nr:hypothetical protein [Acidobacteriaceae bacterium]